MITIFNQVLQIVQLLGDDWRMKPEKIGYYAQMDKSKLELYETLELLKGKTENSLDLDQISYILTKKYRKITNSMIKRWTETFCYYEDGIEYDKEKKIIKGTEINSSN